MSGPIDVGQVEGQIGNYVALGNDIIGALMGLYNSGMSAYQALHAKAVAAGIDPKKIQAALVPVAAKLAADFAAAGGTDVLHLVDPATGEPIHGLGVADPLLETFTSKPPPLAGYSIYETPAGVFRYYPHGISGVDPSWVLIEN